MDDTTTYKNVTIKTIANSRKIKVTIDLSDESISVGNHYISGILFYTWKNTSYQSIPFDEFIGSIVWLDIINIDCLYNNSSDDMIHFYRFLHEYYVFKSNYNIKYGKAYKHD